MQLNSAVWSAIAQKHFDAVKSTVMDNYFGGLRRAIARKHCGSEKITAMGSTLEDSDTVEKSTVMGNCFRGSDGLTAMQLLD